MADEKKQRIIVANKCGNCPFVKVDSAIGHIWCAVSETKVDEQGSVRQLTKQNVQENAPEWCPLNTEDITVKKGEIPSDTNDGPHVVRKK